MKSFFLSLNVTDAIQAFITAFLGSLVMFLYKALAEMSIQFTWAYWQPVLYTAIAAGLASIIRRFLTNGEGKFLTKDIK